MTKDKQRSTKHTHKTKVTRTPLKTFGGGDFVPFSEFSIGFWDCSDSVVFLFFVLLHSNEVMSRKFALKRL